MLDVEDGWQVDRNEFVLDGERIGTKVGLDVNVLAEHRVVKVIRLVFRVWRRVRVEGKGAEDVDGERVVCWTKGGDAYGANRRNDRVVMEEMVIGIIVGVGGRVVVAVVVVVVVLVIVIVVVVVVVVVFVLVFLVEG